MTGDTFPGEASDAVKALADAVMGVPGPYRDPVLRAAMTVADLFERLLKDRLRHLHEAEAWQAEALRSRGILSRRLNPGRN